MTHNHTKLIIDDGAVFTSRIFSDTRMTDVCTLRLGLVNNFDQQARGAVLDLTGDDNEEIKRAHNSLKWYVSVFFSN